MKKTSLILIAIIYIASIVMISVFGMSTVVYNEVIPVTSIECINQTDNKSTVIEKDGIKQIKIKFTEAGNAEDLSGTLLQLEWRVLPDNATNKSVKFIYNKNRTDVEFATDEAGNELGLLLFKKKTFLTLRIMATDGTGVYTDIEINVY